MDLSPARAKKVFIAAVCAFLAAKSLAAPPTVAEKFDVMAVTLRGVKGAYSMMVEVAVSDAQRALGLMDRASLPEERGVLFVYPQRQPGNHGFWMYRTHIPLDIAFMNEEGKIVSIRAMSPCLRKAYWKCPTYTPNAAYQFALEVNRGFFARHGIGVGDTMVFDRKNMPPVK